MKAFRISWISFLEDGTALDGRSLVYADNEQEALQKFYKEKSAEYTIQPHKLKIVSFTEMPHLSELNEKSDS